MSSSFSVDLLSNESATGTAKQWPGGRGHFCAVGTWSGGTVSLQYLGPDGVTYIPVAAMDAIGVFTNTPLSANGGFAFDLPQTKIKAVVTGSPSALYARAARIPS